MYQHKLRANGCSCSRNSTGSAGNCLQRTALTTPLIRQVAKVDIREACTELRGDSETDDGDAGGRNDNRGGRHQGIVVEIPGKGQDTGSAIRTTEDTSRCKLGVLIEAGCDLAECQ